MLSDIFRTSHYENIEHAASNVHRNYEQQRVKVSEEWFDLIDQFAEITQGSCYPLTFTCSKCMTVADPIVRCNDCFNNSGEGIYLCKTCYRQTHKSCFHLPETWNREVGYYQFCISSCTPFYTCCWWKPMLWFYIFGKNQIVLPH